MVLKVIESRSAVARKRGKRGMGSIRKRKLFCRYWHCLYSRLWQWFLGLYTYVKSELNIYFDNIQVILFHFYLNTFLEKNNKCKVHTLFWSLQSGLFSFIILYLYGGGREGWDKLSHNCHLLLCLSSLSLFINELLIFWSLLSCQCQ